MRLFEKLASEHFSEIVYWIAGILIILVHFSPFIIYQKEAFYLPCCDHLDELPRFLFRDTKEMFAPFDTVIHRFGEIKRFCLSSEFYPIVWMFYFFGIIPTFIISLIGRAVVGFMGCWLLLKYYVYPFIEKKLNIKLAGGTLNLLLFISSLILHLFITGGLDF